MMRFDPEYFSDLFEFIEWGDQQLLSAAAEVPEAEYLKDRGVSAGSLHKLLIHMMAAQWVWLSRWRGLVTPKFETDQDHPTVDSLKRRWTEVHDQMRKFLAAQTPQSLAATFTYKDMRGVPHALPLGRLVQHMLDHGTYHRGQANTLLKWCGGQPLNLSLYPYYENRDRSPS